MKLTRRGFFGAAGASVAAVAILPAVAIDAAAADADDGWGVYDDSFLGKTWQGCYVEPNTVDHANEMLARLRDHGLIA